VSRPTCCLREATPSELDEGMEVDVRRAGVDCCMGFILLVTTGAPAPVVVVAAAGDHRTGSAPLVSGKELVLPGAPTPAAASCIESLLSGRAGEEDDANMGPHLTVLK